MPTEKHCRGGVLYMHKQCHLEGTATFTSQINARSGHVAVFAAVCFEPERSDSDALADGLRNKYILSTPTQRKMQ